MWLLNWGTQLFLLMENEKRRAGGFSFINFRAACPEAWLWASLGGEGRGTGGKVEEETCKRERYCERGVQEDLDLPRPSRPLLTGVARRNLGGGGWRERIPCQFGGWPKTQSVRKEATSLRCPGKALLWKVEEWMGEHLKCVLLPWAWEIDGYH